MIEIFQFIDNHPFFSFFILMNMMELTYLILRMIVKSITRKKDKYHVFEDDDFEWKIKIK